MDEMMHLVNDDCMKALKALESNSIDSLVTDPPAGISFMGKEWDDDKGGRKQWIAWMTEVMREVYRVLKPGAHGLVWALPRTSHWTATALEDAGFEIRDVVTHLFGQGFPKSLDISKAIDKAAGAERKVVGVYQSPEGTSGRSNGSGSGFGIGGLNPITAPTTDAAKQWSGWGTALKPASEHWILVRKPCSEKTVAANVLKWGTGGINIDGCRISTEEKLQSGSHIQKDREHPSGYKDVNRSEFVQNSQGRFPANLVLSHTPFCTDEQCDLECAIKMLDEQSGTLKSGACKPLTHTSKNQVYGKRASANVNVFDASEGGASRFFYCAKISSGERGDGNTHPTVKPKKLMGYLIKLVTPPGGTVLDPFMGSGSTGLACKELGFDFLGIEKDNGYYNIAKGRLNYEEEHASSSSDSCAG